MTGRVLDAPESRSPARRCSGLAYRNDDEILLDQTTGADPSPLGETATDAEGKFRVVLDKPGVSVALRVAARRDCPSARFAGPFDSSEENVPVRHPASGRAADASGKVVDEAGKPVAGAKVLVVSTAGALDGEARSLARGAHRSRRDLRGSRRARKARESSSSGRRNSFRPTGSSSKRSPTEKISLQRGGAVRGVVTRLGGQAGGRRHRHHGRRGRADGRGGQVSPVRVSPPAVHHVQALWKDDFAARKDGVRVRKGEETEADLKLKPGIGDLRAPSSRKGRAGPWPGRASLRMPRRRFGGFARRRAERAVRTDARGRFRLPGLAPARYAVEAARDGYLTSSIAGINAAARLGAAGQSRVAEGGEHFGARDGREGAARRRRPGADHAGDGDSPAAAGSGVQSRPRSWAGQGAQTAADGTFQHPRPRAGAQPLARGEQDRLRGRRASPASLSRRATRSRTSLWSCAGASKRRGRSWTCRGSRWPARRSARSTTRRDAMGGARVQMRLMGLAQRQAGRDDDGRRRLFAQGPRRGGVHA